MANIKNKINSFIFDTIDTEEKAYWLGFLWGDGYVGDISSVKNSRSSMKIKIDMQNKDKNHLILLGEFLGENIKIGEYKGTSYKEDSVMNYISFNDTALGSTLMDRYDIKPHRESIKNLEKNLPQDFIKPFLRGLLDADGSISVYFIKGQQLKSSVQITSPEKLLLFIQDYLLKNRLVTSKTKLYQRYKDQETPVKEFRMSGNQQILKFLNWLYEDATIYLNRKKEKHLELLNIMNERGLTNV